MPWKELLNVWNTGWDCNEVVLACQDQRQVDLETGSCIEMGTRDTQIEDSIYRKGGRRVIASSQDAIHGCRLTARLVVRVNAGDIVAWSEKPGGTSDGTVSTAVEM